MEPWNEIFPPQYEQIRENDFSYRRHTKQKEEDISTCECKLDPNDPDGTCGERCLNFLTNTECTPGYCPCGVYCKNQRFQNCEYAKTRLVKTESRGWGLVADEEIKAGKFVIEYCGEVISWREARRRSHAYESLGIKDAYIISLNSLESIDATRKGSLARFINHSCWPNCETRKWNVLGEIRVGIFAKHDIPIGAELAYDYNFEWYGGAKVRCLCGAAGCCGFLGAKSRGFQEDTYLWEDDDDRYSVENIPLYDSAEDEASTKFLRTENTSDSEFKFPDKLGSPSFLSFDSEKQFEATDLVVQQFRTIKGETSEDIKYQAALMHKNEMISRMRSQSADQDQFLDPVRVGKKLKIKSGKKKKKHGAEKPVDAKQLAHYFARKEAKDEFFTHEKMKNDAEKELASLYNEIRPAIEEHEQESQDSVAIDLAEKWIQASCTKLKTEFNFYSFIIKSIAFTVHEETLNTRSSLQNDG